MSYLSRASRPVLLAAFGLATGLASPVAAAPFGGVEFPQGVSSFADAVVSYAVGGGGVTAPYQVSGAALGPPDGNFVSLGDGGSITLRFTDNFLTGSGTAALDLWIFEVGPDVEDTFVEVSKDGVTYFSVGKVFGSTSGIDIDAFGFGTGDLFSFVRLTDDTNEGSQSGITAGADIDALGAITSVPRDIDVPEPASLLLLASGLFCMAARRRRPA